MRRSFLLWTTFALCLAVALGAMAWISMTILRLDRTQREAQRQASIEENVRLALWRMDSALAPLISQETARPYFAYSSFTPAERAYTRMFNEIRYGDVLLPSSLLMQEPPQVLLHFQFGPDGILSSPQVPTGNMRDLAIGRRYTTREQVNDAAEKLAQFEAIVSAKALLARLPQNRDDAAQLPPVALANPRNANFDTGREPQAPMAQQASRSMQELQARAMINTEANRYEMQTQRNNTLLATPSRIKEGVMQPLWVGDALLLARRVSISGDDYVQGLWLNWPEIRRSLLEKVADLLPSAELQPGADGPDGEPHRLASLPARLIPGPVAMSDPGPLSPIRLTLIIAWVCVLIGSAAIGALLWGALSLSERRGAFVSAVTHELRTPLTTVSMYAEMLEEGMLPDEQKRRHYLATLRAEAGRLGHLVDNVLAFSRIERGSANARIQVISISEIITPAQRRLVERAQRSEMDLCVEVAAPAEAASVKADPAAVEQILFNLVDNAGKYAAGAKDRRIHLEACLNGTCAMLRVRDHGPGISADVRRRLFRPFSKSARDAAHSAPGVGLGLALSRRLARQMRGDLRLEPAQDGASFLLTLPISRSS